MKAIKYCLLFCLVAIVLPAFAQQKVTVKQTTFTIENVALGNHYKGFAPGDHDSNSTLDKVLGFQLVGGSKTNIEIGEGDFDLWISDDLNNESGEGKRVFVSKDNTYTCIFSVSSKAKSYTLHFGKTKAVKLIVPQQ